MIDPSAPNTLTPPQPKPLPTNPPAPNWPTPPATPTTSTMNPSSVSGASSTLPKPPSNPLNDPFNPTPPFPSTPLPPEALAKGGPTTPPKPLPDPLNDPLNLPPTSPIQNPLNPTSTFPSTTTPPEALAKGGPSTPTLLTPPTTLPPTSKPITVPTASPPEALAKEGLPPQKSPHAKKPILILILAVIGTLLASVAAIFIIKQSQQPEKVAQTPTPTIAPLPTPLPSEASAKEGDPTANWNEYINQEHGFQLKYPPDWMLITVPNETYQTQNQEVWISPKDIGFPKPNAGARAPIVISITNTDPRDRLKSTDFLTDYQIQEKTINSLSYTEISGTLKELNLFERFIIIDNSVSFLQLLSSDSEYYETSDQILSTLQFTATPTAPSTASGSGSLLP